MKLPILEDSPSDVLLGDHNLGLFESFLKFPLLFDKLRQFCLQTARGVRHC